MSTSAVKKLFFKQAAVGYRDLVCRVKREVTFKGIVPDFVLPPVLNAWKAFWGTPEAKAKSEHSKKNRNSESAGPGTGKAIHFGGSRNAELHAQDLVSLKELF